jgi:fumarate reductase subunit C
MLAPLVLVVLSLGLISLLLFGMTWFEQRVLSPQALIVHAARSRQAPPEHVEMLVARQSERLLQGLSMSPADRAERTATAS